MSGAPLRVGVIGYGLAGAVFHAPLVDAVPGLELASIVTSNEERAADARSRYPGAAILGSPDALWAVADAHDLVVVAAPNRAHVPLGLAALERGLHLVVDKPLAASVADATRLAEAAEARGVVACVYQNRRFDSDFLTLRRLVAEGALGELVRLESGMGRWVPEVKTGGWRERAAPEDAGGVLFDLGPHLIDQALELLGPARSVYAEIRTVRPGAEVDDDVFLALDHESGARSHLSASLAAADPGVRFRALGTRAAYVKHGLDVQEEQLVGGARPGDAGFGEEPREARGTLRAGDSAELVETELGRYVEFYELIERAIRSAGGAGGSAPPPVPLEAGIATLRVIEAAQASAAQRVVVPL